MRLEARGAVRCNGRELEVVRALVTVVGREGTSGRLGTWGKGVKGGGTIEDIAVSADCCVGGYTAKRTLVREMDAVEYAVLRPSHAVSSRKLRVARRDEVSRQTPARPASEEARRQGCLARRTGETDWDDYVGAAAC